MKTRLPNAFLGVRVETWLAIHFLLLVPVLFSPVLVSYDEDVLCQQTRGCESLDVRRFKWEQSDDRTGFRKVMILKTTGNVPAEQVAKDLESKANQTLAFWHKWFPVREPKVVVERSKNKE